MNETMTQLIIEIDDDVSEIRMRLGSTTKVIDDRSGFKLAKLLINEAKRALDDDEFELTFDTKPQSINWKIKWTT